MVATIGRIRVSWTGDIVGGGLSTFFVDGETAPGSLSAAMDKVGNFFNGAKASLATGITLTVENTVDLLQASDGQLVGTFSDGSARQVISAGPTTWAAGVGAAVTWDPEQILNGRRLKGRTFLAPLGTGSYDAGSIAAGTLTALQNAAASLISDLKANNTPLQVWHRPAKGGAGGSAWEVSQALVKDQIASLRGRRY